MEKKQVFLSYSWDSSEHQQWVRKLADSLEEHAELHVVWDGYDLDSLVDKNKFMESGVANSDYILLVATANYKRKADSRSGGVGIETYLASAVHWDAMQSEGKTKILVLLREKEAVPNYLAGHLYIDFTSDENYVSAERALLAHLRGLRKVPRPPKRRSIASEDGTYTFTKVEDLIRIGHTNRRAIVNGEQGTDFSGPNRIKYELWETKSPAVAYYLALATNINITQTTSHAISKLKALGLHPTDLTVLRPRAGRAEQALIANLFLSAGFKTNIHEFTYKDYIWEFCIDESLKGVDPPSEIANYTDQSISFEDDEGNTAYAQSARDRFVTLLQQSSSTTAHLVVAPGGMGKTSLCLAVAAKLHNRTDLHSSVVIIQAESIKRYVAENGVAAARIDSIFQLYELYARYHHFDQVFDRNTFELAFLSGNLVVIIDGLDEFVSLFPDTFNLEVFLSSLAQFHRELGSSAVLLTTRNSQLLELALLDELEIERHELLGFDSGTCRAYLNRRFRKYTEGPSIALRVLAQIDRVQLRDHEERVVPFFVDIAATVVEDGLRDNTSEELEISEDPTPYPSNNELTDHIIHSVMRREEVRHGLDLATIEVVQLLSGLVADYSKKWPRREMLERLTLLYDSRGASLDAKISLNPLLIQTAESIELRYGFLASYFDVVHLLHGVLSQSLEREFLRSLARLNSESNEFRDLKRYFSKRRQELLTSAKSLVSSLRKELEASQNSRPNDAEQNSRALSLLLNLVVQVFGGSAQHTTEVILQLYDVQPGTPASQATISGLHLRGDFPAMDFSNLLVVNSRFSGYGGLLPSKFGNTRFMYCTFEFCFDSSVHSSTLDPQSLDQSCELGDLREFITLARAGKQDENRLIEAEARKFLHSFFRGDRFTDNRKGLIRFSNKVPGLADNKFDRIISAGYIGVKREKEVATFYEISESFRPSVRRLLTDNYTDSSMRRFFAFLKG